MAAWIQALLDAMPNATKGGRYIMEKHFTRGFLRREYGIQRERWSAHDTMGQEHHFWKEERWQPHWVDIDRRGRIIYAELGCLLAW